MRGPVYNTVKIGKLHWQIMTYLSSRLLLSSAWTGFPTFPYLTFEISFASQNIWKKEKWSCASPKTSTASPFKHCEIQHRGTNDLRGCLSTLYSTSRFRSVGSTTSWVAYNTTGCKNISSENMSVWKEKNGEPARHNQAPRYRLCDCKSSLS